MGSGLADEQLDVLDVRGVCKAFGRTMAVNGVSFRLRAGEIVALLGENGAGKSTLLSILAGLMPRSEGTIMIGGRESQKDRPRDAIQMGVGLVHQHLSLVPGFTVWEQLALAGWRGQDLPAILGGSIRDGDEIDNLAMGERQRVEIAKVLARQPRILLLDEPTSILAPPEVRSLFALLRELRAEGVAIVIVTHKLREALALADRVLVMASGKLVRDTMKATTGWTDQDERALLDAMFGWNGGASPAIAPRSEPTPASTPMLAVHDLRSSILKTINLAIRAREIVTVVGIDGQGQRELAEALAGYARTEGSIRLDGEEVGHLDAEQRARRGVALLVDDRLGEACVPSMSIAENVSLKRSSPRMGRRERATDLIERWGVKPDNPDIPMRHLSGGNMQRVLLGRELDLNPRLLIAINPVHGLDHRTSALVWQRLRERSAHGGSVLVFTGDLDEALSHSDLVGVMHRGQLSGLTEVGVASRRLLGDQMVNGW